MILDFEAIGPSYPNIIDFDGGMGGEGEEPEGGKPSDWARTRRRRGWSVRNKRSE